MKFKLADIISNRLYIGMIVFLFVYFNYRIFVRSGVFFSGGGDFAADMKYMLVVNNFIATSTLFSMILALALGAGMIGPDVASKNIYITLSTSASRTQYYLFSCLTGWLFYVVIQIILMINFVVILCIIDIHIFWQEVLGVFGQLILNASVLFSVTACASVLILGYGSVVIGIIGYCFFHMYTYNIIPLVNMVGSLQMAKYRNMLCYLFPMTDVIAKSVNELDRIEAYAITIPVGGIYFYQIIYMIAVLLVGCILMKKKEL